MDPPSEIPTAAESFRKDDLEFRTITTVLNFLESSGRFTSENLVVPQQHRRHLKLVVALSSLLAREHDIVAILTKRNEFGTTFVLGSNSREAADATALNIPGDQSTSSTSSCNLIMSDPSQYASVTSKPSSTSLKDPQQRLLGSPDIDIVSDVFGDQSFESHVYAFERLFNGALSNPHDGKAVLALDIYSFFHALPKIQRHFAPGNQVNIAGILISNFNGTILHSGLDSFLSEPPTDSRRWLPVFHQFFIWFLEILRQQIEELGNLHGSKKKHMPAPSVLPECLINQAFNNLELMRFFAWESEFLTLYIAAALPSMIPNATMLATDGASTETPTQSLQSELMPDITRTDCENEDPWSPDGKDEWWGLDILTEFETGEEHWSAISPTPGMHPFIQELRLISLNNEDLNVLHQSAPKSWFRFEVIQYSPADSSLKPWRELIHELFPKQSRAKKVVKALLNQQGPKFNTLRQAEPGLRFAGQSHYKAVLAGLCSLSKSNKDISWTNIPASILDSIRTCYPLLATSQPCCPVCASTISLLSAEAKTTGHLIHALSKHSRIVPCAFPIGLPRSIRANLLAQYRGELRRRLLALVETDRRSSLLSAQSNAVSVDRRRDQEHLYFFS
ncbi:hypothetical protein Q9L58_010256 [Maublancomyces gigas]|uniref:Uncharacterized protein n=1 Tax=Discina gigas TaxID=1032678 RepID=A0ABR3G4M7_9PEZI